MKKFLYFIVILFNILGAIFSLSLVFTIENLNSICIPFIIFGIVAFILSVTVTISDFNHKNSKVIYVYQKKSNIIDYQKYFAKKKNDFIIA